MPGHGLIYNANTRDGGRRNDECDEASAEVSCDRQTKSVAVTSRKLGTIKYQRWQTPVADVSRVSAASKSTLSGCSSERPNQIAFNLTTSVSYS